MVATGVRDGSSGQQALRSAAEVGDKWVFKRIESELRRARYMTRAPWDSLHGLADELAVPGADAGVRADPGDRRQVPRPLRTCSLAERADRRQDHQRPRLVAYRRAGDTQHC